MKEGKFAGFITVDTIAEAEKTLTEYKKNWVNDIICRTRLLHPLS